MLKNGEFLQERYEILDRIGSGGMSDVYKAKCHKLNRLVAVKVLKAEFSEDAGFISQFKMEAQAAAGLSHPNIVNVYDVVDDGDMHYIVMELIEGITLKNYIAKKGKLDAREAIGIAIQIAQGMSAAHDSKIVHRDIKPQNIIISKDGKAKVADFGIARGVSRQGGNTDSAVGSVHYIAPEQASGKPSDERSDIYSFGITLYEMVTGQVPFDGDSVDDIAKAQVEQEIAPPSAENSQVPQGLEAIILRCTRKDPEERYGSAAELINDLRRALIDPEETPAKKERQKGGRDGSGKGSGGKKARPSAKKEKNGTGAKEEKKSSKGFERLVSAGGIAGAILIVAVLLFLVGSVTGIFKVADDLVLPTGETKRNGETLVLTENQVNIPELQGITEDAAKARLAELFLTAQVSYEYSETVRPGYVMAQDAAGTVVEKESAVKITVSKGSGRVQLEELGLVGRDVEEAKAFLAANEIAAVIQEEPSDSVKKGCVIRTDPSSVAYKGESLKLFVSSGPSVVMTTVPNIAGQNKEAAIKLLQDAGLGYRDEGGEYSDTVEELLVVRQTVEPGAKVPMGTTVGYVLSLGRQLVPEHNAGEGGSAEAFQSGAGVYVASLNEEFDLGAAIGPGSDSVEVPIKIQLRQNYEGKTDIRILQDTETVAGNSVVSIRFPRIEGISGVTSGTVEVVNVQDGRILQSYSVTFSQEE